LPASTAPFRSAELNGTPSSRAAVRRPHHSSGAYLASKTVLIPEPTSGIGAHGVALDRGPCGGHGAREKLETFLDEAGHPPVAWSVADAAELEGHRVGRDPTVEHFRCLDAAVANAGFMSVTPSGPVTASWAPMVSHHVLGPACWPMRSAPP